MLFRSAAQNPNRPAETVMIGGDPVQGAWYWLASTFFLGRGCTREVADWNLCRCRTEELVAAKQVVQDRLPGGVERERSPVRLALEGAEQQNCGRGSQTR